MPAHLLFLFIFQSGLAFAFTWFIARVILSGSTEEGRLALQSGMRKVRLIVVILTCVLTPAFFFAYLKSLPEGKSWTLAAWPAAWICMILLSVVIALSLVIRAPAKPSEGSAGG